MIEVKNLVKRYGEFEAVRGVSFSVKEGVICGFLGPNGAGKSTTMNIIAGTLAATSGEVTVNGYDIYEDPIGAKSSIGYLPEQPPLYPDMTVEEYLAFVGRARGLSDVWPHVDAAMKKTGLTEYADRLIKNLSKGYRQRVGIAQAIIADPKIVILDEPTVGLDPRQIIEIRSLIRELGKDHTVILSSHILGEISEVCDEAVIIAHGEIVAADTLENLVNRYEGKNIVDLTARGDAETVRRIADSVPGVTEAEIEQKPMGVVRARITADRQTDVREPLFFRFADARMPILSMSYEETTLEKVFLELTADRPKTVSPSLPPQPAGAESAGGETESEPEPDTEPVPESVSESVPEPEPEQKPEPEPEQKPAPESKPNKPEKSRKQSSDDEYTPLFGG
ncbi:MAG: ABC transporter ATP-binding protein [Ruminococcaceae bacterium]|jgi:ABC-2 type transport system ATP-binding protein|nr:ABC transporter ATP-binding protein [Oscillospiraceae bacterium]